MIKIKERLKGNEMKRNRKGIGIGICVAFLLLAVNEVFGLNVREDKEATVQPGLWLCSTKQPLKLSVKIRQNADLSRVKRLNVKRYLKKKKKGRYSF